MDDELSHRRFTFRLRLLLLLLLLLRLLPASAFDVSTIPFSAGVSTLFGESNIVRFSDDRTLQLHLNQYTGAGFKSSELYDHGFFSAKIKLPADYSAGIVVAFYTTNQDVFPKAHDELDIEFLGNIKGKPWRFQTNVYGNGSTSRGREERYYLWFDPTKSPHSYSILWTNQTIIFYVDDVPIREIVKRGEMGGDFPAKPMALYATIWDASDWATSGGKYKANYKYAPFVVEFTDLVLQGCKADPLEEVVAEDCGAQRDQLAASDLATISEKQRWAMRRFRAKYMYYSYCYDRRRYETPLPECVIDAELRQMMNQNGRANFDQRRGRRRRFKNGAQAMEAKNDDTQDED